METSAYGDEYEWYLLPRPPGSMWPRALSNALAPNPVAPNPVLSVRSVASLTPGGSGGKSAGLKGGFGEPVGEKAKFVYN